MPNITEEFIKKRLALNASDFGVTEDKFTKAAVLIPLFKESKEWKVLFTKRSTNVQDHKGQVSFPGGAFEWLDRDLEETALRETEEEVGIPRWQIRVLGRMKPFASISNYLITPIVGIVENPFQIKLAAEEVDHVFTLRLDWLSDPGNYGERDFKRSDGSVEKVIFYKETDGELVWGITARIMANFVELIT